jgi:hypothetical protein
MFVNAAFSATLGAGFAGAFYGLSHGVTALKLRMIERNLPKLPEFDGKTTQGVLKTSNGKQIPFDSGGLSPYKNISATHVEGKAALYMRKNEIMEGTIYHNNPNGICNYCDKGLATLLPKGAKLNVIPPVTATAPNPYWIDIPKTYIGNNNIPSVKPN